MAQPYCITPQIPVGVFGHTCSLLLCLMTDRLARSTDHLLWGLLLLPPLTHLLCWLSICSLILRPCWPQLLTHNLQRLVWLNSLCSCQGRNTGPTLTP